MRRRGGQAVLTKLASIQRKAATMISGAMSTTRRRYTQACYHYDLMSARCNTEWPYE